MNLLDIKPNVVSKGVEGKFFLFYGEPSTRKTTVATQFPKSLLLATEVGYSLIPNVHAVNITSWVVFREVLRELKRKEVMDVYNTIVIDTVGLLADMCQKYICDINGIKDLAELPWGKGWNDFKKEFRTQLNAIAQMGYAIVFIAHSEVKRDEKDNHIIAASPQLDKRPSEAVRALVDFTFFLLKEKKTENPDEVTVYAYSKLQSTIDTKSRARYLSERFEFNFENLQIEVAKAVQAYEDSQQGSTTDVVVNLHEEDKIPFETLKTAVMELATKLLATKERGIDTEAAGKIVDVMKDVRISQANESNYDQLEALQEVLLEISERI